MYTLFVYRGESKKNTTHIADISTRQKPKSNIMKERETCSYNNNIEKKNYVRADM